MAENTCGLLCPGAAAVAMRSFFEKARPAVLCLVRLLSAGALAAAVCASMVICHIVRPHVSNSCVQHDCHSWDAIGVGCLQGLGGGCAVHTFTYTRVSSPTCR
jgi:hypothetical protein